MNNSEVSTPQHPLKSFLYNCRRKYFGGTEIAHKYIEDKIVEIIHKDGTHLGNGLLITDDGFILTCGHCIPDDPSYLRIRTADGEKYPIIKECWTNNDNDLSLIKSHMRDGKLNCFYFSFFDFSNLLADQQVPVILLTRCNNKVVKKSGLVYNTTINPYCRSQVFTRTTDKENEYTLIQYCNHWKLDVDGRAGDSGGLIVTPEGLLVGIFSTYIKPDHKEIKEKFYPSCVKITDAISLISQYCNRKIYKKAESIERKNDSKN